MENKMLNMSTHTSGATSQFKFELLKQITNNFSKDHTIGSGAYGVVYKGVMDNQEIAVKKLIDMPLDQDSEKKFQDECINLLNVQHKNIVRLIGYCDETHRQCVEHEGKFVFADKNERALCFEYLQGGSLDTHVSEEPCRLDWDICYTIIKGVSKGLNHLHKYSIFHLDIKPANILLDKEMTPKIGDFGLSRLFYSTKTCTTTTPLGTPGFTPPEYVDKQEISQKYDVFSLGVVIIHMMAGRKHYYDHVNNPSKIIELVCENWEKRLDAMMWSHASQEVNTCIEIALRCVKSDRQERPTMSNIVDDLNRIDTTNFLSRHEATNLHSGEALDYNQYTNSDKRVVSGEVGGNDRSVHDPMDSVHESNKSIMRDQASHAIGEHASKAISEARDVTQTTEVDIHGHQRRNPHLRVEGNLRTPTTIGIMDTTGVISGFKECEPLFQWARSTISYQWSGTEGQRLHQELFFLETGLQYIMDTLPAMYDLIERAEWRSHKHRVAELLPNLKDAVYDADDLLDEFRWYMLNLKVEGDGSQSLSMEFFDKLIEGSFIKSVNGIRGRLDNISTHLLNMGLHEVTIRFDKSVRPETSSFPNETELFGRDMELKKIIEYLCKPGKSGSANPKLQKGNSVVDISISTSTSNQISSETRRTSLTVLPIVGIGGVGKTTLAQHICNNAHVKSHFDQIIWVCVSDDFDVKRLTKEAIESCSGKQTTTENLNSLQNVLSDIVSSQKFLIVLDDMWDDVLKENGQCWKRFCAPLKNVLEGSMMLVTTRCQNVAEKVGTMGPVTLKGLKDDLFWNFFKLCVFESGSFDNSDPELERIGRSIVPKLKGSPLAAKTLGRILRMNLQAEHWNCILESELWKLRQEDTEILPALRLSYVYLPFHLKICFSLCAMYPKDYKFVKGYLAEIWVAEGFVEPQGEISVQDISCEYFNELLRRSFFQPAFRGYKIHDLLHDMAQKVSEFDCFIIKRSDFNSIPPNVRHLSIHSNTEIDFCDLMGLRRLRKLRTLLCYEPLATYPARLMAAWCSEFRRLRVIFLASTQELPASIGTLKHLRYLRIVRACPFKSLPAEFCWLYNLQIVLFERCKLESLPTDFSKLVCLQRFESDGFRCDSIFRRFQGEEFYYEVQVNAELGFRFIKNINQLGELEIYNMGKPISKEHAAEAQLQNKKHLEKLDLKWSLSRNPDASDIEVLRFLQPPSCLKSLVLHGYPGGSLPSWSEPENLPSLMSPSFISCDGLERSSVPRITDLDICGCDNLLSLEHVIHPAYIASLKKMTIKFCENLVSVPAERFGDLRCLEEWDVHGCVNINFQSLVAPSLKRLVLGMETDGCGNHTCGTVADNVDCSSLTYLFFTCNNLTSIQLQKWNLPALEELHIARCQFLTSIIGKSGQVNRGTSGIRAFLSLTSLSIKSCLELSTIGDLLAQEYLPAIQRIHVIDCSKLVSLPGERFENFSSLKELEISNCLSLSWRRFALPSSLQILSLDNCGDISSWVPSCLQNLASLVTLKIQTCQHITSIPGNLWRDIRNVSIDKCPKLEELKQPMLRGSYEVMEPVLPLASYFY